MSGVWIQAMPAGQEATAAYMVIANGTGRDLVLQTVECPVAGRVEVHEMSHEDGMMRMRKVEGLKVPAGGGVALEPGGVHLMLLGLKERLAEGDEVSILLHFDGMEKAIEGTGVVRRMSGSMAH